MSEADKSAGLQQEFTAAGREIDARQPPEQAQEQPFLTEQDKHEAARAALTQALDEKVLSGKIDRHEAYYQLQRFENNVSEPQTQDRSLKFFEDKDQDKERAPAGEQQEHGDGKNQGDGRTLAFFEDRNKDLERSR